MGEHVVVFDDDPGMFERALAIYNGLLADCAPIPAEIFRKAGTVEIEQLPTFHNILTTREAFVVEPAKIGTPGATPSASDPTAFVLKTEDYRRNFTNALPPMIGKAVAITVDHIRKAREQQRQNTLIKGIESREIPRLEVDPERGEVRFRGTALDLEPGPLSYTKARQGPHHRDCDRAGRQQNGNKLAMNAWSRQAGQSRPRWRPTSLMTTLAPWLASIIASSRPMSRPAPVTIATLPAKRLFCCGA